MGASPLRLPPPADGSAATPAVAAGAGGASASAALSALAAVAAAKAAKEAQEAEAQEAREAAAERRWGPVLRVTVASASLPLGVSLLFWSLLPILAGWTPRVILSGSMEPRVHVGDVVVTRGVPGATVVKGQVVTVRDPDHSGKTRTHRVLRRAADGTIVTKGDANPQADSTHIANDDVLGLGVVRVPYVGRPAFWIAERNWLALGAVALFLGWCTVTALPGSRRPKGPDDDQQPPSGGSRRWRPSRRVAATVAVAAVAVGAATGPADAAFKLSVANPLSQLSAAGNFYPYKTAVTVDAPYLYWRLDETSGTAIDDSGTGNHDGTLIGPTYTLGQAGALAAQTRSTSMGVTSARINSNSLLASQTPFSVEAWVRTSSSTGGPIVVFGNKNGSTSSTTLDRALYLAPNGKVMFGVGSTKTAIASNAAINNNAWHHVVATYATGTGGMKLYVDGAQQTLTGTATAQTFSGYWRVGTELMTGWPSAPTDTVFEGSLDEIATYTTALSSARVLAHYQAAS